MNSSQSHKIFKPYNNSIFNNLPLETRTQSRCNIFLKQKKTSFIQSNPIPYCFPNNIRSHKSPHATNTSLKRQIRNPMHRNESEKNLPVKRRISEMGERNRVTNIISYTQKKIQKRICESEQILYETSSTIKDIQNSSVIIEKKSSFYPSKRNRPSVESLFFSERKFDGSYLDIIRLLGKGKYGNVFLVKQKYTGFMMALKVIQKKKVIEGNLLQQFIRELKIQFYLNHPGIIKLYGFFDDIQNFYQIMELGCDGQLYDKIKDNTLTQQSSSFIARSLLSVIDYMHSQKVLHRDIKPQNIVIVLGNLKICDFGWAVYNNTEMRSTFCGTPLYLSPELIIGQQYDEKVDLWAIGIMIFQLYCGSSPFRLKRPQDLRKIVTHGIEYPKDMTISPQFRQFTSMILQKNPQKRSTSKELLQTNFIKNYIGLQICDQICNDSKINQRKDKDKAKSLY